LDLKSIKELAEKFSVEQLSECADKLENDGKCVCSQKEDLNEAMSDVLQALEVRNLMDAKGITLQESVREFSKRVRSVLTK
jgi:DNA-binding protein H-NS